MVTFDDKSGYDHVPLHENSSNYFGFQFAGWVFSSNTLPFGWKTSAYVYQKIGMAVTSYLRKKGIGNLQYIDDRLIVVESSARIKMLL